PSLSPVRFNAAKHGIFSVSPVIPWFETEEDWNEFRDSIFASLNPKDGLEQALTDRVAVLFWRIMRIIRFEREAISDGLSTVRRDGDIAAIYTEEEIPREMTPQLKERLARMAMHRLIPDEDPLNKIMRYETKLHRYLLQPLHQLYALRMSLL